MPLPSTLQEFLVWLKGAGALAVVGWFISWFLEKRPWWQNLSKEFKDAAFICGAVVLGLAATALLSLPPEYFAVIDPYFKAIVNILALYLATQVAHAINPFRVKTKST